MSQTMQDRLRQFAQALLERRGALVDWPDQSGEGLALLDEKLQAELASGESLRLTFQPGGGGLCLNLATDFLDRVGPLLEGEPRTALHEVPDLYLRRGTLDEPIAKAFTWQNARVRVVETQAVRAEYHAWFIQAALDSDDRWEELVGVTVNSASLAEVDLGDVLGIDALPLYEPAELEERALLPSRETCAQAVRQAGRKVQQRAGAFVTRLEGRLDRDRKRLRDYYHALVRESEHSRRRQEEDPAQRADRRRAVELELRRKLAELDERYAIRACLAPLALLRLEMPVLTAQCDVQRRQARKIHRLFWNPLLKAMEPLACSTCGAAIFSVFFSDDDVLPHCAACHG